MLDERLEQEANDFEAKQAKASSSTNTDAQDRVGDANEDQGGGGYWHSAPFLQPFRLRTQTVLAMHIALQAADFAIQKGVCPGKEWWNKQKHLVLTH